MFHAERLRTLFRVGILFSLVACAPLEPTQAPSPAAPVTTSPALAASLSIRPTPTRVPGKEAHFDQHAVAFWDALDGLVVGQATGDAAPTSGVGAMTTDGGKTWTSLLTNTQSLDHLVVAGATDAWATEACEEPDGAPCPARVVHSGDRGATWIETDWSADLVSFIDSRQGWAAKAGGPAPGGVRPGGLLQTQDGGETWSDVGPICSSRFPELVGLQFVETRKGWSICSGEGSGTMAATAVLETTDGGTSWQVRSAATFIGPAVRIGRPPEGPVDGAFFFPSGRGWVWQGRSGTERTVDGGAHWNMTPPGRPEEIFVSSMWFVGETQGFALAFPNGGPEQLLRTGDKGVHWRPAYSWPG